MRLENLKGGTMKRSNAGGGESKSGLRKKKDLGNENKNGEN